MNVPLINNLENNFLIYENLRQFENNSKDKINELFRNRELIALDDDLGVFAVIKTIAPQICKIIGISGKGLLFQYIEDEDLIIEDSFLDILKIGEGFCIETYEFEVISNYYVENSHSNEFVKIKECYVEFKNLSIKEIVNLDNFIKNLFEENTL